MVSEDRGGGRFLSSDSEPDPPEKDEGVGACNFLKNISVMSALYTDKMTLCVFGGWPYSETRVISVKLNDD